MHTSGGRFGDKNYFGGRAMHRTDYINTPTGNNHYTINLTSQMCVLHCDKNTYIHVNNIQVR